MTKSRDRCSHRLTNKLPLHNDNATLRHLIQIASLTIMLSKTTRAILGAIAFIFTLSFSVNAATKAEHQELKALLQQVSKAEVRNFSTRDFGRDQFTGAWSVLMPENQIEEALHVLRAKLPKGYIAFIGTTRSLSKPPAVGVELVVAPGNTQYEILDIAQTDAVNYDMVTKDLKAKLRKWDTLYGINIWQAETDTIQLKLNKLPKNIKAFAREVYKFCPDIVDQGVGTVGALEKTIREQRSLYLWWD